MINSCVTSACKKQKKQGLLDNFKGVGRGYILDASYFRDLI